MLRKAANISSKSAQSTVLRNTVVRLQSGGSGQLNGGYENRQEVIHPSMDKSAHRTNNDSNLDKKNDLYLLEQGLKKIDERASSFTNYLYKINRLPPNYADNQLLKVDIELERNLQSIIGHFNSPIKYAFGYGSGVFEQAGYSDESNKPQIDLIFGVTHPDHFHSLNMRQNPDHYSSLRFFGSEFVSKFQEVGAGVYFNPFVSIHGSEIKYGVVSMARLLRDLATWDSFYLAGRLQKPVKVLKNDLRVQYWNQLNLKAAATLAKQRLKIRNGDEPENEFDFYKEITALSYIGDIRYKLGGENPRKIDNIVSKNMDNFRLYYQPIYKDVFLNNSTYLPQGFTVENANALLTERNSKGSTTQTAKGVLSAGIMKSVKYAWAKKMKAIKSN